MELSELKIQADQIRETFAGRGRLRWPNNFKKSVLTLIESGHKASSLASTLEISLGTIYNWKPATKTSKKQIFTKIEVVKEPPQSASSLILSWSAGLELKGLTFSQLQELLREGVL